MQYANVKRLVKPLIKGGHDWQSISLNGEERKSKFYLSNIQWFLLFISSIVLLKLNHGISKDLIGYVMSAFSISVSLFMSLLVSIFDKFENTDFDTKGKIEIDIARLKQKKNFFKRFISITSYLVVLSILIIILCSLTFVFNLSAREINLTNFTYKYRDIDLGLTLKCSFLLIYRISLNYFLLNYLLLTFFVAGSAYEYYISELDRKKIE